MAESPELVKAVLKRAQQVPGRNELPCADALDLARRFEARPVEVGRICNQHNIRICKCQLGCFA